MAASKPKMVTSVFRDRFNAHSAYSWLTSHGYNSSEINLLMAESTKAKYYSNPDESPIPARTHAAEGAAAGGAIGTAIGATAAAIAAIAGLRCLRRLRPCHLRLRAWCPLRCRADLRCSSRADRRSMNRVRPRSLP